MEDIEVGIIINKLSEYMNMTNEEIEKEYYAYLRSLNGGHAPSIQQTYELIWFLSKLDGLRREIRKEVSGMKYIEAAFSPERLKEKQERNYVLDKVLELPSLTTNPIQQ